jgi:beta-lactamase regulating signal transducer with metallopeptidase domain
MMSESEDLLVQFFALENPLALGKWTALGMFAITSVLMFRRLGQFYLNRKALKRLSQEGSAYQETIGNNKLAAVIKESRVQVVVSDKIQTPMATYERVILLPKIVVEGVSREELEAILAHEWEHICWQDPLTRCFSLMVSTLFWWVPTRWWRSKVMEDQEMACDLAVEKYGLSRESLASSLLKVMNQARSPRGDEMCFLTTHRSLLLRRFHALLGTEPLSSDLKMVGFVGIGIEVILFLTCLYLF